MHRPQPAENAVAPMRPLWTQPLAAPARGLTLAREKGWILAWDETHWLYLLNQNGERQAQIRAPGALVAACCSVTAGEDVDAAGEVAGEVAPDAVPDAAGLAGALPVPADAVGFAPVLAVWRSDG